MNISTLSGKILGVSASTVGPRWPLGNLFSPDQFSIKIFRRTSKPVGWGGVGGEEGGGRCMVKGGKGAGAWVLKRDPIL